MKSFIATLFAAAFIVSLTGCPAPPADAVTGADQTAIEAYQEAEAAEQAALVTEMDGTE